MSNGKTTFFFGAGAECGKNSFGLSSGADFLHKTMRVRYEKLYGYLKIFYKDRLSDNYAKEYRDKFIFEKRSHTFRKIIQRAANEILVSQVKDSLCDDAYKKYIEAVEDYNKENARQEQRTKEEQEKYKDELKRLKEEVKKQADVVYKLLIKSSDDPAENEQESDDKGRKYFKDFISFYGAVEKDFSTIIDPNHLGLTQFWRVINYFWSAYFVILEPVYKNFKQAESKESENDDYKEYILNDLSGTIKTIYSENKCYYKSADKKSGNYYKAIRDKFHNYNVITTNYTPFVEHYFPENNVYLAGKLCEFELPTELTIKDIRKEKIDKNEFIFPFIMTQAPIKPIIIPEQIENYHKAIEKLDESDNLVIIGYSVDSSDNHINAILRDFLTKKDKQLIYCHYTREETADVESVKNNLFRRLCIKGNEDLQKKVTVIPNNGKAEDLLNKLQEVLQ